MVDFTIVQLILVIGAQKRWLMHQVDFGNSFVEGTLIRAVYVHIPSLLHEVEEGINYIY